MSYMKQLYEMHKEAELTAFTEALSLIHGSWWVDNEFMIKDKVKYDDPEDKDIGEVKEVFMSPNKGQVVLVKWIKDDTEVWFNSDELIKVNESVINDECYRHEMIKYVGLTETYDYCKICGHKEVK